MSLPARRTWWSVAWLALSAAIALLGCGSDPPPSGGGDGASGAGATGATGGSGPQGGTTHAGGTGTGATGTGGIGNSGNAGGSGGHGASPPDCPDGVICVTTFPFEHSSTTTGAASDQLDGYSCAPTTNESGPEVTYRVDVPEDGFLGLELGEPLDPGVDVDVHLLQSLDPATCIDRGNWRAGAWVTAGRYWVTADTWVTAQAQECDGAYTLTFGLTTVTDLAAMGMDATVASDALYAFDRAWAAGEAQRLAYAVTNFALPSYEKRLWILNLADGSLLHNTYVPHGEGSSDPNDTRYAISFSNVSGSNQSSLGVMQAAETYTGTYGYSMRLDGLEPGYNDNVRSRAIVVHPWDGSTDAYVSYWGECAPTWGCAGLDPAISAQVIDFLSNGGLLLFHYPDGDWSVHSAYLP